MALQKCSKCGAQVSSEAAACPQCGHQDPVELKWSMAWAGVKVILQGLFWFVVIALIVRA